MSFIWPGHPQTGDCISTAELNKPENKKFFRRQITNLTDEYPAAAGFEKKSIPFATIPEVFRKTVSTHGDAPALCYQLDKNKPWERFTWKEYLNESIKFAKSLMFAGCESRECITIKGFNHFAWNQAFVGATLADVVPAGIYPTNGPDATCYILDHTASRVTVVDTLAHVDAMLALKPRCPLLKYIVCYMEEPTDAQKSNGAISWKDFLLLGSNISDKEQQEREALQRSTRAGLLVYTSGTTGNPKGVILSHDAVMSLSQIAVENLQFNVTDRMVSYMPLSHIAACMLDILVPLKSGQSTHFAQPDAMRGSLSKTLTDVRPTLFLGVPRVWEKIQESLMAVGRKSSGFMKWLATKSKSKTYHAVENVLFNQQDSACSSNNSVGVMGSFFDKTVNKTIKSRLGLDQCRIFASGAAPLAKHTQEYFMSLGMPLSEVLGMSESSAMLSMSQPFYGGIKKGACGRIFDSIQCMIVDPDEEGNGELLFRGRPMCSGYFKDEANTKAAIDENGFFRTGDICRIDKDGFIFVTGRSKELIITAGGENVAPVPIEDRIMASLSRLVSNVMVIGDMKKFLSCIMTLKQLKPELPPSESKLTPDTINFLALNGVKDVQTVQQAMDSEEIKTFVNNTLKKVNKDATSRAQCIQKFIFLPHDFTEATGELTATWKLKRSPTAKKFAKEIDSMYAGDAE